MTTMDRVDRQSTPALREWFAIAREWLERFPLSIIQLAMAIAIAAVFFNSGLLKINSWEFAIKLFQDEYKVPLLDPETAARIATFNELTFPALLFVGFATRLATLPLLGMVAVIEIFVYPQAWTEHLLWASILVFLLTRGPGPFSLDYLLEQWLVSPARRRTIMIIFMIGIIIGVLGTVITDHMIWGLIAFRLAISGGILFALKTALNHPAT
jgi:putative oxidoreductase